MPLLPDRHPQRDFFILDISDVIPKDDTASMEHPLFSLSTKPDMRQLEYQNGENSLRIVPSGEGLPTIFDKDILIFCISQLMHRKRQGKPIGKCVRFSARELLIATNRKTGGIEYKRLRAAFTRLRGTTFETNIVTGKQREVRFRGLLDEGGFVMQAEGKWRLDFCEVILSDWLMRAIESNEVVTISNDYFRLRRPLERRIYEIARKHCGDQKRWQISLANLKNKTGSNAPSSKFRYNMRQIIEDDHIPTYRMELTPDDLLVFTQRSAKVRAKIADTTDAPMLQPDTLQKAYDAACKQFGVRIDKHALHQDWVQFWRDSGRPKFVSNDAAFIGFAKSRARQLR